MAIGYDKRRAGLISDQRFLDPHRQFANAGSRCVVVHSDIAELA
jgi:hypothetical protein